MTNTDGIPRIGSVAVLGAGVMGAQIAAHLANANVEVLLYELPAEGNEPNADAARAIDALKKMQPSPLVCTRRGDVIQPANYAQDLNRLRDCDLVIEAIVEDADRKRALYQKVAPHLSERCILASNTSGLSVRSLADVLPPKRQPRFCGTHFFNPPRYMRLVELVPTHRTAGRVLESLERFLTTVLGKGVIYAKDTPGFIANRVGAFSFLVTTHHAAKHGISPEAVDELTGTALGRPKSATYRTADLVGLDVLARVVDALAAGLKDDPWHQYFRLPPWLAALVAQGALGEKTGGGIYRKEGQTVLVMEPTRGKYRPSKEHAAPDVLSLLEISDPAERFAALRASRHPHAQFLWSCYRDAFHYSAFHLETIAETVRDLDFAMRWGFGWKQGPFETWHAAGWQRMANWIAEDIAKGKALVDTTLPRWAEDRKRAGVYTSAGAYAPGRRGYRPRPTLDVYRRQLFPDALPGEPIESGETLFETDALRLWHSGDDIAVLSFKTKMHVIRESALDDTQKAIATAEQRAKALIIWHRDEPFSVGADLCELLTVLSAADFSRIDAAVTKFQETALALRYSMIPTVAAARGLALDGGCELLLHCDHVVAALETYIGLVATGVGLLPASGGCKEMALRAARFADGGDLYPIIQKYFRSIALAKVARSGEEAREYGFLQTSDDIVMHPQEILYVAKVKAQSMADAGYRPAPRPRNIRVAGAQGLANLTMMLVNMQAGGFISAHDFEVARCVGNVLCGGELPADSVVDEEWLLRLEREAFLELIKNPRTRARIEHTLKTGKPLRN